MNSIQSFYIYIIKSNLINFLVMMFILYKIFEKANLKSVFEKMAMEIETKVKKTEKDTKLLKKELHNTSKKLKEVPKIQEEIINEVKNKELDYKIKNDEILKQDIDSLNDNSKKNISNYNTKEKEKLTQNIMKTAVDLAKIKLDEISDNELQKHLIDNALLELDEVEI